MWPTLIPWFNKCEVSSFQGLKVVNEKVHVLVERTGQEGCKSACEPFTEFLEGKHIKSEETVKLLGERIALMTIEGIKAETTITITAQLKDFLKQNLETAIYMGIGDKDETSGELKKLLN